METYQNLILQNRGCLFWLYSISTPKVNISFTEKPKRWLYLLVKLILFLVRVAYKFSVFCLSVDGVSDQIQGPCKQPINGKRLVSQEKSGLGVKLASHQQLVRRLNMWSCASTRIIIVDAHGDNSKFRRQRKNIFRHQSFMYVFGYSAQENLHKAAYKVISFFP